jgi:hypothetical protein
MSFGGNSSRCIKRAAVEGHDHYRSLPMPILGSILPSTLRDRHSRHLSLLPFVTRSEYSCTRLYIRAGNGFREFPFSEFSDPLVLQADARVCAKGPKSTVRLPYADKSFREDLLSEFH